MQFDRPTRFREFSSHFLLPEQMQDFEMGAQPL